ncbi:MAG: Rieske (2Fe-2S) protein [Saprospiraceae bacterium]|nr:Rieske (2Fe-2S) protein [Saprospiraceae bacterium]
MDRKEFIKTCGLACLGGGAISLLIQSCSTPAMVSGSLAGENMIVSLSAFEEVKNKEMQYRKYILVHHPQLRYPICVFRFAENNYYAVLLQCTHQGNEVSVNGDRLHCSSHGSEFDQQGKVKKGPATVPLRSFDVTIQNQQLAISLKAV